MPLFVVAELEEYRVKPRGLFSKRWETALALSVRLPLITQPKLEHLGACWHSGVIVTL